MSGLSSPAARAVLLVVWLTGVAQAAVAWDTYRQPWLIAVALGCALAGSAALAWSRRDPLPLPAALVVASVGPVNAWIVVGQLAPTVGYPSWLIEIGAYLAGLLAVRGRAVVAWAGIAAVVAVVMSVSAWRHDGHYQLALPVGAVLVGTTWRITLTRLGARLRAHRGTEARAAVAEWATREAVEAQRDELRHIAELAGPSLTHLARGGRWTGADRAACRVVEAQVRDRLRARALSVPELVGPCWNARTRGIDVLLLDDSDDPELVLPDAFTRHVADTINALATGRVTVRVLPRRHAALAMLLRDDGTKTTLTTFDRSGAVEAPSARGEVQR